MDPDTKVITDDDMERMAQAAIDQGDGGGPTNDVLPCGFPPLLALGLLQRVRRAEAIVRDLAAVPGFNAGFYNCAWCHEGGQHALTVNMFEAAKHTESCPYRRAVEATKP